ncbi:MAG: hypothetical protein IKE75_03890 [Bacilli bacterium]|nr:hypothetical protein [Bacilli bacterium]
MNENKRLIIVGASFLIILGIILAITFWPEPDQTFTCGVKAERNYTKIGKVNYKQYECLTKGDKKIALVYTDKMTKKKKDALEETAKSINNAIYYLDTNNIDTKKMKKIKKDLKYTNNSFKKDVIIVMNDGKVDTYKENILTNKDELKTFLKDAKLAKFACNIEPSKEYENLGEASYDQYKCLYESEEPFAIILSQTTCGYCQKYKPFINEYIADKNIPLYVIEVNTLEDEERSGLLSSLSYFDNNEGWGTPLTLGIKNKEVIDEISGFTDDESQVENFFKKIGLK